MDRELREIITHSTFHVDDVFVYCKVRNRPTTKHFLVTEDDTEITVVTTRDRIQELDLIERNKDDYVLISLNVSVPFYSVGFLAAVSSAIAAQNMNVLMISTYSKDYILVRTEHSDQTKQVLLNLGFREQLD